MFCVKEGMRDIDDVFSSLSIIISAIGVGLQYISSHSSVLFSLQKSITRISQSSE